MAFLYTKPDMSRAWANNGAKVEPSSAIQDSGWIAEKPPYQTENWLQNRSDVYMQALDERGVPNWDSQVIYQEGSISFQGTDVWISLQDSNLNHSPVDDGGWWIRINENANPPGSILMFAIAPPVGWLDCNGTSVSRTQYSRLFTKIGTTFGVGDGSTTFGLPDIRERVIQGAGNAGRATGITSLGQATGFANKALSIGNMPSHNHGGGNHSHSQFYTGQGALNLPPTGHVTQGASAGQTIQSNANTGASGTVISSQGSGTSFSLLQPTIVLHYGIKT